MVVVGLVVIGLTSGADRCVELEGADWPCVRTSGVVGVVGVVPYDFGVFLSSWVSRKIGMPGKAGHRLLLPEVESCPGVEIG